MNGDDDLEKFKAAKGKLFGGRYSYRQAMSSQGVTSFDRSESVPEGRWTFVVQRPDESVILTEKSEAKIKITVD